MALRDKRKFRCIRNERDVEKHTDKKFPQLADIKVAMPSIQEQNAIVELLCRLDERTKAEERELVKLVALKSGILQQLFVYFHILFQYQNSNHLVNLMKTYNLFLFLLKDL